MALRLLAIFEIGAKPRFESFSCTFAQRRRRTFSIALLLYSPPALLEETGTIQLAVKKSTWPPAAWIHTHCQVGSKLSIRVGGDFYYEVPPKSQDVPEMLLIAGGVGINPLLSILRHITPTAATSPSKNIITLLYSAKNSEEILFKVYVNFFVLL